MDVVKEDTRVVGGSEKNAEDKDRWRRMTCCGDPWSKELKAIEAFSPINDINVAVKHKVLQFMMRFTTWEVIFFLLSPEMKNIFTETSEDLHRGAKIPTF